MKTFIKATLPLAIGLVCLACGCSVDKPPASTLTSDSITLATTTSTQDSGLLDALLPIFERQTGVRVKVVAVGSGQALELGRRGDADVLLTHAPTAEEKFMSEGWGQARRAVMHNDFVVVGPDDDPALAQQQTSVFDVFRAIAVNAQPFVSRGDESGTHQKETAIWRAAGVEPQGDWYIESGTSMAQALRLANEKRGYVLADRATFLSMRDELHIVIVFAGDPQLFNHYSVITLNAARHPHIREVAAQAFANFLTSDTGRHIIAEFGATRFGEPLFVPDEQIADAN